MQAICPADIKANTSDNPLELSELSVSAMVLLHLLSMSHIFSVYRRAVVLMAKLCV